MSSQAAPLQYELPRFHRLCHLKLLHFIAPTVVSPCKSTLSVRGTNDPSVVPSQASALNRSHIGYAVEAYSFSTSYLHSIACVIPSFCNSLLPRSSVVLAYIFSASFRRSIGCVTPRYFVSVGARFWTSSASTCSMIMFRRSPSVRAINCIACVISSNHDNSQLQRLPCTSSVHLQDEWPTCYRFFRECLDKLSG